MVTWSLGHLKGSGFTLVSTQLLILPPQKPLSVFALSKGLHGVELIGGDSYLSGSALDCQ